MAKQNKGLEQTHPKCSLSLKLARKAPTAVLLRRGPSNWVQMIRWDIRNDSFEAGQWFKGRIYPEFSELSEDGELLLYSARKTNGWTLSRHNDIGETWTALSRPPYFTALALWPNGCWTGGGVFTAARSVKLSLPYPKVNGPLPPQLEVQGTPELKQLPLSLQIALRAGWSPMDYPLEQLHDHHWQLKTRQSKEVGQGAIRIIKSTRKAKYWTLHTQFSISNVHGETDLGEADLVDVDGRGRLIKSVDGRLLVCETPTAAQLEWQEIANFSSGKPAPMPATDWARNWPSTTNDGSY